LKPTLGNIPVQKLTAARVQAQYGAWEDLGLSSYVIRGCAMRLSQALNQGVEFQIVSRNVAKSAKPPKLGKSKPDVWTVEEAKKLIEASDADWLHPLWHFLLLEGMRKGEALGLRWQDINVERGTAHISQSIASDKANGGKTIIQNRTKTAAGARTVRLTPQTRTALRDHRHRWLERKVAATTWHDYDLIVCTGHGTPINPTNVTRSFNALVQQTGLRRIRVHDLRHTAATLLLRAGVPAKIVSERLGHASIGITLDLYSHVLPDMQDDAASAMGQILQSSAD
jgi:integrase